jgi:hypothetical protein
VIDAWVAELVRSGRAATAEQARLIEKSGPMILFYLHCTPETAPTPLPTRSRRFRRREKPVILRHIHPIFGKP